MLFWIGVCVGFFFGLIHAVPYSKNQFLRWAVKPPKSIFGVSVGSHGHRPLIYLEILVRQIIGKQFPPPPDFPSLKDYP